MFFGTNINDVSFRKSVDDVIFWNGQKKIGRGVAVKARLAGREVRSNFKPPELSELLKIVEPRRNANVVV